jgi:Protein of unknown function (DUF1186)
MEIPEILKELEPYTGRFPMQAMQAAIEHREAITPELLRVVEAIAANPIEAVKREDYMLPVFALYLLAQFREQRAYPVSEPKIGRNDPSPRLNGEGNTTPCSRQCRRGHNESGPSPFGPSSSESPERDLSFLCHQLALSS